MSSPQDPGPLADDGRDEVIELTPTIDLRLDQSAAPNVALVAGPARSMGSETTSLLLQRLRTVSIILLVIVSMVLAWSLVNEVERDTSSFRLISIVNVIRIVALGAILAVLYARPSYSNRLLRGIEYALFGGLTLSWMVVRYQAALDNIRARELGDLILEAQLQMFALFVYMILHGLFIPNRWTGTARVVGTMALAPVVTLAIMKLAHPDLIDEFSTLTSERMISTDILIMVIGVFLATYGAGTLNAMRREVHEARKFGQYQLIRRLGAGGMGEVHLAEHALLKRPCALKLIHPHAASDPTALARFEREVQTTSRLTHPHTIEIFDYGHTEDGTFYYVMEYLPGMSAAELVDRFGPISPARAIFLLRQASSALAEAHAEGLIHRDLKPANLFISERGGLCDFVKVLDFGLVKLAREPDDARLTADLTVSGTPLYMSPEQSVGDRGLDARTDLYALGCIAYHLLTGRPPFVGDNPVQVMISHARDQADPPSTYRPDLPEDLEAVILRCLAKSPADRFVDAIELERALASCSSAADWDHAQAALWWEQISLAPSPIRAGAEGAETLPHLHS